MFMFKFMQPCKRCTEWQDMHSAPTVLNQYVAHWHLPACLLSVWQVLLTGHPAALLLLLAD